MAIKPEDLVKPAPAKEPLKANPFARWAKFERDALRINAEYQRRLAAECAKDDETPEGNAE